MDEHLKEKIETRRTLFKSLSNLLLLLFAGIGTMLYTGVASARVFILLFLLCVITVVVIFITVYFYIEIEELLKRK